MNGKSKGIVIQAILEAIDEVNTLLPNTNQLKRAMDASLFGPKGNLDSLGLINLMVAVERRLECKLGRQVNIADEHAMSKPQEIFETVETLTDHIHQILNIDENAKL